MTTNDTGTLGRDEAVRAVDFLLTRIASWTSANWQQHLRFEFGDECAERMIAAIAALRDGEGDGRYAPDDAGEDFEALSDAAKDMLGVPFPAPPVALPRPQPEPQPATGGEFCLICDMPSGEMAYCETCAASSIPDAWVNRPHPQPASDKRVARYTRPLYTTHVPCWALPAVESALSMLDLQGYWHSDLAAFRDWLKEKSA